MAEVTMTVVEGTKAGMLDLAGDSDVEAGNSSGGDDYLIPNDGKTVLVIHAVTGDTWTPTPVTDRTGRTETLTNVVSAGDIAVLGPWLPELWNDTDGYIHVNPTTGNVGDLLLAMSFAIPS